MVSFSEHWLKIQDCWTTFWWPIRHTVTRMEQLISRTYDSVQLQTLTNCTNAPLWPKSYRLVQRSYWTLLLWGWRRTSHHSHTAVTPVDLNAFKQKYGTKSTAFRNKHLISYALLLNSCAPWHSGRWWPPKRHCTQKVKQCKTNLSTVVHCNILKLYGTMLFVYTSSSLLLPHVVLPFYRPFIVKTIPNAVGKNFLRFNAKPVTHIITTSL